MIVYRVCNEEEVTKFLEKHEFSMIGKVFSQSSCLKQNNHKYEISKLYLHFFKEKSDILYLSNLKNNYLCSYDIPDDVLDKYKGVGFYWDLLNCSKLCNILEYAIKSNEIKMDYLIKIEYIENEIDIEDYLEDVDLKKFLKIKYKKKIKDDNNR